MESESGILSESFFFTARKAPLHSHIENSTGVASSSSSSTKYYSARIHTLMTLKSERGMSEKDAEIEASKSHWTEVESNRHYTPATSGRKQSSTSETGGESCGVEMTEEEWAELYKDNVEEMRRLQMENEDSDFFQIGGKVEGEMIAKGGQATIYEHRKDIGGRSVPMVMKVFEVGYSVRELRKQWPLNLLCNGSAGSHYPRNPILTGRLLNDGRFAFEMLKFWGDVRKLLDVRMQHNGNRHPPFMMEDGSYQEDCIYRMWNSIACGMQGLNDESTLHRDLKASNVLIESTSFWKPGYKEEDRLDPLDLGVGFVCFVADYECSAGVVGTGFWRAPEILEAVKNRTLGTSNVFTPKVDVYSYAMTCYEILTGYVPFEHLEDKGTNMDRVLQGKRPTLPQHLKPWVIELFQRCWHEDPLVRPTFLEIMAIFKKLEGMVYFWKQFMDRIE
ncbi:hypothetical protein KC19_2G146400 [Ceratodon purpureus]|uniref:Protein kinase domain-containing protein n=1 Tax=Ceratodon purpureus TaxID=3225 RepID=A0A8T0IVK5_CERPU|nr:hypothetical protein KC19_2G146400 [Ceratodon purpureus]